MLKMYLRNGLINVHSFLLFANFVCSPHFRTVEKDQFDVGLKDVHFSGFTNFPEGAGLKRLGL